MAVATPPRRSSSQSRETGRTAVITVTDDGEGIGAVDLERIFQPGVRIAPGPETRRRAVSASRSHDDSQRPPAARSWRRTGLEGTSRFACRSLDPSGTVHHDRDRHGEGRGQQEGRQYASADPQGARGPGTPVATTTPMRTHVRSRSVGAFTTFSGLPQVSDNRLNDPRQRGVVQVSVRRPMPGSKT